MNESLEQEIWKDIPNYEGLYQVSNFGNVKSLPKLNKAICNIYMTKEKILKPVLKGKYYGVCLVKNQKRSNKLIHQLVAMAFLGHIPCGHEIEVNHIDRNRLNNNLSNLELLTKLEHTKHTHPNKSSQYTGVTWSKQFQKWQAQVKLNGIYKKLGYFIEEYEAHQAYQKALHMYNNGDLSFLKIRKKSSQYKGVSFEKKSNKWEAYVHIKNKKKRIGLYNEEYEAHLAYENEKNNK